MSKCKYCGRLSLVAGDKVAGLCKTCSQKITPVILRHREAAKKGLVAARFSEQTEAVRHGLEEAASHLRCLIPFEKAGIPTTTPAPSLLLEKVSSQTSRLRVEPEQSVSGLAAPEPMLDQGVAREQGGGVAGGSTLDVAERSSERRRSERRKTGFYAILEPGGVRALVSDASPFGLFLSCPTPRSVGTRLRMTLYTGNGHIRAEGVVRRTGGSAGYSHSTGQSGMGIHLSPSVPELRRLGKHDLRAESRAA